MTPYYQENGITIFNGDCREIVTELPGGLTITDPPYNVGYHYADYGDNLSSADYGELIQKSCQLPCVIIHYPEDICEISLIFGKRPDEMVAWVYNSNTARQWRSIAWWGLDPDFTLVGQSYKNQTDRRVRALMQQGREARLYDWWEVDQVKNIGREKTAHPCQIPLLVIERIIKISQPKLIIDPFLGSGTTLLAAKRLGIAAIGIEISEEYCKIAVERLRQEVFDFAEPLPEIPAAVGLFD